MGRGQSGPRREPTFDSPAPRVEAGERPAGAKSSRRKRGKGKKRKGRKRPLLVRLTYWSAVAGLWLFIAAAGAIGWVGAHLPPIQSLEIPKRPPTIEIVDSDGHALARRGDLAGPPVALKEMPPYVPK